VEFLINHQTLPITNLNKKKQIIKANILRNKQQHLKFLKRVG